MKFILVINDSHRKNLAFVSPDLNTYTLPEAVQMTREGQIQNVHVVRKGKSTYVRTNPRTQQNERLDDLSVSISNLLLYVHGKHIDTGSQALGTFAKIYTDQLKKNETLISPTDQPAVLASGVKEKLTPHRNTIFEAAKKFNIDPYLLGAILLDEISRLMPYEDIMDKIGVDIAGTNTSIGIAQVQIDTANSIIKQGLYNPNPRDNQLPFHGRLNSEARRHMYIYLIQPKHNINFAAAYIRSIIDVWRGNIDLSQKPEIIGTLYAQGYGKPHNTPQSIPRGEQIANEFYSLATKWLNE